MWTELRGAKCQTWQHGGGRGNCWDNAVAESFFSSLKKERIRKRIYKTRDLARADIFDYIEVFYNRARRHSHLGGVSPEAFEQAPS
jgi:Integrase core domain.